MLESTNDLISVVAAFSVLLAMAAVAVKMISLKVTSVNLRKEAEYYEVKREDL